MSTWAPQGVLPLVGETYEFEDFVGARFVGTVKQLRLNEPGYEPICIEFRDGKSFETNLPLRFREMAAA